MKKNNNALNEEELKNVSGGSSCDTRRYDKIDFKTKEEVGFVAQVGDIIEVYNETCGTGTSKSKVMETFIEFNKSSQCYYDKYKVDTFYDKNIDLPHIETVYRNKIQKP